MKKLLILFLLLSLGAASFAQVAQDKAKMEKEIARLATAYCLLFMLAASVRLSAFCRSLAK